MSWRELEGWTPAQGVLWVHLDYSSEDAREWLCARSGLDAVAAEALLAPETRPRLTPLGDAALIALRGVNLNPGSDPEDMVSVRMWAQAGRVVTTRRRRLLSASDTVEALAAGRGPCSAGELVVELVDRLGARMEGVIYDIDDRLDGLEEESLGAAGSELRSALSSLRREAIMLRRYIAPQREAVSRLAAEKFSWLDDDDRIRLREVADKLIRYVEDLDSVRDRAMVTQEELVARLSEQLNQRMYVLSIVAAIFLPLGFLTGLLGVNVGGIPGADSEAGFPVFSALLVLVLVLQIALFRSRRWL